MKVSTGIASLVRNSIGLIPWSIRPKIRKWPGLAAIQRAVFSRTIGDEEFEHKVDAGPAKGITFPIKMPEDKNIWTGTYEATLASRVAGAIRAGDVAFDIGGWHGFFAGVMAASGASAVHVFEPLPENVARIARLIDLNRDKRMVLHPIAVGNSDGVATLSVMPETSMAKLSGSVFQEGIPSVSVLSVTTRSLDSLWVAGSIPLPQVVKLDVEGSELLVLRGALKVLRAARPRLFIEVHSPSLMKECSALLAAEGYLVETLPPDEVMGLRGDVSMIFAMPDSKKHHGE